MEQALEREVLEKIWMIFGRLCDMSTCRTDLRYSELFLKGISSAKKSASKVKIGQIVNQTVLFLKRSRHLGYPDYVVCYGGSKSVWDENIGFQVSVI